MTGAANGTSLIICISSNSNNGAVTNTTIFFIGHAPRTRGCRNISFVIASHCTYCSKFFITHQFFKALVGVPESEWFTSTVVKDSEFAGGAHVRTAVVEGTCVFRDRKGRGCLIHGWALAEGLDYHSIKPLVSTLFPLTFEHGVLVPSGEAVDGSLVCAGGGPSLYEGARDELLYYFGAGLVAELDKLAGSSQSHHGRA